MISNRPKAALALSLVAGLLLTATCMLFICPVIASAAEAPESCHSAPGSDSEPATCPYAVMQPVYAPPLVDHDLVQDEARLDGALPAVAVEAGSARRLHASSDAPAAAGPPGPELHVRLCVFRI